jgi:hypothetical protein
LNAARYTPGTNANGSAISTTGNTDARRLFAPEIGNLNEYTEDRRSNYHSLQLSLQKRFSQGLTFRANYTWSRAMGNYHPEVVPWFADPSIDRMQYGPLDIDRRNRLVLSWVWELPTVQSANPVVKFLVNGWEWSGIGQYQSGTPFEVTSGRDNSLDGIGDDRAKLTGSAIDPAAGLDKRVWFNGSAFAINDPGTFGVIGPNAFTGPSMYSYDMGLFKRFTITERINLQFRAEFFNAFNQVNFANPNTNVSGGGFGTISATHSFAGDPRILQFGLKLQF